MLTVRRSLYAAVLVVCLLLALPLTSFAQEAAADEAKALLKQGLDEYKALNFRQAQATFLKASKLLEANPTALSDADKKTLDDHLDKVRGAIVKQSAAYEAYKEADAALKDGRFDDAINGFAAAAISEYLNESTRRDAQAQLALARTKKEVAKAAAAATAEPKVTPTPAVTPPVALEPKVETPVVPTVTPTPKVEEPVVPTTVPEPKVEVPVVPTTVPEPKVEVPVVPTTVPEPKVEEPVAPVTVPEPKVEVPVTVPPVTAEVKAVPAPSERSKKMLEELQARRAMAVRLLEMGKKALDDKKPGEATSYFQRARDLDPDLAEADQLLKYSSKLVALETPSQAGILSRLQRRMLIARQAAEVEINKDLQRSAEALASANKASDFDLADQAAKSARETLEANKSFFDAREYRNTAERIQNQLETTAMRRDAFNKQKAAEQAGEIERIKAERVIEERRKMTRKIEVLRQQAGAQRGQRNYDQALAAIDQILLIDPTNSWAAKEKEVLTEFGSLVREGQAVRTRQIEDQKVYVDMRRGEIPWHYLIRYPKNWKALTQERKEFQASAAGESEADAALREKLKREIERLNFHDIDFRDVVQFLREYSDANIHVNWRALTAAGIEPTTKVSVDVRKVSAKRALDLVLRDVSGAAAGADAELRYVIDGGVLTISTKSDLAREPIRRVYDVRDLLVPVPDFEGPRIDLETTTSSRGVDLSGTGSSGGQAGGIFEEETTSRDRRKDEITKEELTKEFVDLVKRAIDRESWSDPDAGGGGVGFIQVLNGQLVVTQTAENHQALSELIEKLREAKTIQITIEARFITVDSGFLNSVGVDIDFYFNLGSRLGSTRTADPWTALVDPATGNLIPNIPTSNGQSGWGTNPPGNRRFTPIAGRQNSIAFLDNIQTGVGGNLGATVANVAPALDIRGTFLDDIQVDFLIQATQAHSGTRTLTAPKISLANGQRSYITVARQQAYVREYIPYVAGNVAAFRPVVDYVPTGSVLDVAATASADRRYVLMTIRPQISALEGMSTFAAVQLPNVSLQDLQTSVSVPDGGTLLLGGQKLSGETEQEMGAPILSKIPVINRLFTNRATVRDERTLLVLVKPKIIINEAAERESRLYVEEPDLP